MADNAQYWLGEAYYVNKSFPEALVAFQRVVDNYPQSRKLPDALLKIGYCNYELKDYSAARAALSQVVDQVCRYAVRALGAAASRQDGNRETLNSILSNGEVTDKGSDVTDESGHVTDESGDVTNKGAARPKPERLRINEIFHSLQGEADAVGFPTVFVRLTGCPLRCQYCDTEYAFHVGDWYDIDTILEQVDQFQTPYVCVTGGEPLAQPNCLKLLRRLCDAGYTVSLETSGAMNIAEVDSRVSRVVDVKTPDSTESTRNRVENFALLTSRDQLKFVICSRQDYEWSKAYLREHDLQKRCQILFSPSYHQVTPTSLAEWILADRLPVRFQFQLHKLLWGDVPGK